VFTGEDAVKKGITDPGGTIHNIKGRLKIMVFFF
jgi:hypothetical protein